MASTAFGGPARPAPATALQSRWIPQVDLTQLSRFQLQPTSTSTSTDPGNRHDARTNAHEPALSPSSVSVALNVFEQQHIVTHTPVQLAVRGPAPSAAPLPKAKRPRISESRPPATPIIQPTTRPTTPSDPDPGCVSLGSIDLHINIDHVLLPLNGQAMSESSSSSASATRANGGTSNHASLMTHFDGTHLFFFFLGAASDSATPTPFLSLHLPENCSTYFRANINDDDDVDEYDIAPVIHSLLRNNRLRLTAFYVPSSPDLSAFALRLLLAIPPTSLATAPPPTRLLVRLMYPHAFPKSSTALSSAVTAANLAHLFSAIDASQDATFQRLVPAQLATVTQLYPFQRRTVGWCLARELGTSAAVRPQRVVEEQRLRFVCLRRPRIQGAVPGLWLDVLSEELVETVEEDGPRVTEESSMVPKYDGFLAEEMGLGKSLIMLAVILANPYSEPVARARSQSDAPAPAPATPVADAPALPSPKLVKTTLIVTPPALIAQWQSEIATHTPSLTVHVYQGGSRLPEDPNLGQYDVVLTTFRCLNGEFNLAQTDHGRSRRFERKYERPTSYLTACVFWRVVMDEAQMVGEASNVTQILCQIPRIHSWCMTGTPFSRSITADLTHLSRFLRHPPLPYDGLISRHRHLFTWYVRQIMHRTSKSHIKAELDLPPQQDVVVRLHLNAVEADSYEQVATGFHAQVTAALAIADRGEPEVEVGESHAQFEARHRAWVEACGVLSQALSTLRLAANHPALARRMAGDVVGGGHAHGGGGGHGHGHGHGHHQHHRHAAEADAAGAGGAQAFAIVNVLRDASLRNLSEYYRMQREMGAVKVKQAMAHDHLEAYDTAIDILSTHLTHLGALADSLAADKLLAHAQSGTKHDLARISHLESELQLQIHQVLFLLAGLHHVKGDEERENALYAQAEATRRDMLKEHIGQVEKVQAVVRRDVEREQAGLDVRVVGQVKVEVRRAVDAVADLVDGGGDVQADADDQDQRARPWAKQKSKAAAVVGKGRRKRKHVVEDDADGDEEHDPVEPELAGLYVMGGTLDDAVAILDALEQQAALVDEWRPVLEAKLLMPLYRDQPSAPSTNNNEDADEDEDGQAEEADPTEYDLGLQSQHVAESHLAQLTLLVHDMRHIVNRTAPLSAIDAQVSTASKRRRARRDKLTAALGEAVIDALDMGSLHESQLLADVADDSDHGLTHPELERPLRQARLDAVVSVAGTSLAAVQHLLTRVAGDEQVELDRNERDRCKAIATRIGMVIDHVLRQIGKVEAALVHYRKLFNARVVYFQELQEISDSVAVPDELDAAQVEWVRVHYLPGCAARMRALEDVVPRVAARRRYLRMLLESYGEREEGVLEVECIVCTEKFENGYMTPCGHLACRVCMRRWLQSQPKCPECRADVRPSDLATVVMHVPARAPQPDPHSQDPASDADGETDDDESTAAPAPTPSFPSALAHSLTTTSSPTLLPGWHYTSIQGHYGAKITAVTQFVCTMMAREPAAKLLCFSQFEAILDVIKYSLALNNVHAVHFSPPAVHAFQTDRDTRVLLLNAKSQAAGLTLNKARYILMIEPIANAAIDRQAITRVHRIGQQHTTHVVRFVVAGTVEERVHQLLQSKYRDMHEDDDSDVDEHGEGRGDTGMAAGGGGGGVALGVAKVTSKAFNGRNEIVDPADMLFCLSDGQPADSEDDVEDEDEGMADGEEMDWE